ncbi:phosphotransferase family protein [Scopulibacillus cellulosilyticus]|uniref:Phosphotransferase family protein n=1 Tax=Scopulibacillus cellulosilyticus TaxID=2665665 RepID=A0ABW2PXY2_9BACL
MADLNTIPVRKGEELDIDRLEAFLRIHISGLPDGSLEIKQFSAGLSNLTYALSIGNWEAVLRRPPLGPVAPKAHDMKRESNILKMVHPVFPLAPKPLLFYKEWDIVGSPFFIMERRHGFVLDKEIPAGLNLTKEDFRNISETMVDTLVKLHNIDLKEAGLDGLGHPEGFMDRQVNGWIKRYERSKTDQIGGVDQLTKWLADNIPASPSPTFIHYDFKLNNALFSKEEPGKLTGIFDWEMSTIGDPLADLGVAMSYWTEKDDPDLLKYGQGTPSVTVHPGFYTRKAFIESYARKSGRDVSKIHFYLTFAYFKLAVICQQIYFRWKKGQTEDERFAKLGETVNSLIQYARSQIR